MRLIDADALITKINDCVFTADMTTTLAVNMATKWIENAPTVYQWVSCDDYLPKEGKAVLITFVSDGISYVGEGYRFQGKWYRGAGVLIYKKVLSWMPMPNREE